MSSWARLKLNDFNDYHSWTSKCTSALAWRAGRDPVAAMTSAADLAERRGSAEDGEAWQHMSEFFQERRMKRHFSRRPIHPVRAAIIPRMARRSSVAGTCWHDGAGRRKSDKAKIKSEKAKGSTIFTPSLRPRGSCSPPTVGSLGEKLLARFDHASIFYADPEWALARRYR